MDMRQVLPEAGTGRSSPWCREVGPGEASDSAGACQGNSPEPGSKALSSCTASQRFLLYSSGTQGHLAREEC